MSSTTANMGLTLPDVGSTTGPDWASEINGDFSLVDSHDHSSGKGVKITPSGMNITIDLEFNGNNATELRTVRFEDRTVAPAGTTDLSCMYSLDGDLYYRNGDGTAIAITTGSSISGAAGNITGLTSPAQVVYSSGIATYTFLSDVDKAAALATGDLIIYKKGEAGNTATIKADTISASYSLTLPTATPSSSFDSSTNNLLPSLRCNSSGTLSIDAYGSLPLGAVIAVPAFADSYLPTSGATAADIYGLISLDGQTISDPTSPFDGVTLPDPNDAGTKYTVDIPVTAYTPTTTYSGGTMTPSNCEYTLLGGDMTLNLSWTMTGSVTIATAYFSMPTGYQSATWASNFYTGFWFQPQDGGTTPRTGMFYINPTYPDRVYFQESTGNATVFNTKPLNGSIPAMPAVPSGTSTALKYIMRIK